LSRDGFMLITDLYTTGQTRDLHKPGKRRTESRKRKKASSLLTLN
jgi:hypothetical protein